MFIFLQRSFYLSQSGSGWDMAANKLHDQIKDELHLAQCLREEVVIELRMTSEVAYQ